MSKIANTNSISGTNNFKKFLQGLHEKVSVNINYNKNLIQVIGEEIRQDSLIFKKSDALKIQRDLSYYSTDVVDHICIFFYDELQQVARQKLYYVSLVSVMCEQDEMLAFQIKQRESFNFSNILKWILEAWSYIPDEDELQSIYDEDEEIEDIHSKENSNNKILADNVSAKYTNNDNRNEFQYPQKNLLQKNIAQNNNNNNNNDYQLKGDKMETAQKMKNTLQRFEENKKRACLRFSCQILGGLDIKQFNTILEQLLKSMQNLLEEDNSSDIRNVKTVYPQKDANNNNIRIVNENEINQVVDKQVQNIYDNKDEILSDQMLNEKNSELGENPQQNPNFGSENIFVSEQNISQINETFRMTQNNEFIIDCLLQIIKNLEEERIRSNHVEQCLLFSENSQLKIDKLRKGKEDFQIVLGFKITLKRKSSFILLRVTTERSSPNEILLEAIVNINYDGQKTNIKFILQKQKTENETFSLELGLTKNVLNKWISLQIIFPSHKDQVKLVLLIFIFYFGCKRYLSFFDFLEEKESVSLLLVQLVCEDKIFVLFTDDLINECSTTKSNAGHSFTQKIYRFLSRTSHFNQSLIKKNILQKKNKKKKLKKNIKKNIE